MLGILAAALALTAIDGRDLDRLIEQKMAVTQVPGASIIPYQ